MAAPVNSFKANLKAGKQTIGCWLDKARLLRRKSRLARILTGC